MENEVMEQEEQQVSSPETPEEAQSPEQDLYDIFFSQGVLLVTRSVAKIPKNIELISDVMVAIVSRVVASGKDNGYTFSPSILLHGSKEILIVLLTLNKIELTEQEVRILSGKMVGKYYKSAIESGTMTKEEVIALSEQAKAQQTESIQPNQPIQNKGIQPTQRGLLGGSSNG